MNPRIFSPKDESLILDFATSRINLCIFTNEFDHDLNNPNIMLQDFLESATDSDDENALDLILTLGHALNAIGPEHVPILCAHLLLDTHNRHEEIASLLQKFRDPYSITALATRCTYAPPKAEAIDNGNALFRKCIWALHDIGTTESHNALEELVNSDISSVQRYAKKRLRDWNPNRRHQKHTHR